MKECNGKGVRDGEICMGCPACDYVAAAAKARSTVPEPLPAPVVSNPTYAHHEFLHMHSLITHANAKAATSGWALVSVCPSATGAGYVGVWVCLDSNGPPGVG